MRCARSLRVASHWSWGSWSPHVPFIVPGTPPLQIHQPPSEVVFNSGFQIWPASNVFASYLVERGLVSGARILEIGSGTGALGLACAAAGAARVVLTERTFNDAQPSRRCLDLLERNVLENERVMKAGVEVIVDELDFERTADVDRILRDHGPFDLVIGCEIMYEPKIHVALARALAKIHAAHNPGSMQMFLGHFARASTENLNNELNNVSLEVFDVHEEGKTGKDVCKTVVMKVVPEISFCKEAYKA